MARAQVSGDSIHDGVVRIHKHKGSQSSDYTGDSCQGIDIFLPLLVRLWREYKLCVCTWIIVIPQDIKGAHARAFLSQTTKSPYPSQASSHAGHRLKHSPPRWHSTASWQYNTSIWQYSTWPRYPKKAKGYAALWGHGQVHNADLVWGCSRCGRPAQSQVFPGSVCAWGTPAAALPAPRKIPHLAECQGDLSNTNDQKNFNANSPHSYQGHNYHQLLPYVCMPWNP